MMRINKKFFYDNLTTIFYALIIAIIIRSVLFQPFYIPSSSMEPTLLVGDRLFVSKYTYGYSKHSFPFSPNFSNSRFFFKEPERGVITDLDHDAIAARTEADLFNGLLVAVFLPFILKRSFGLGCIRHLVGDVLSRLGSDFLAVYPTHKGMSASISTLTA